MRSKQKWSCRYAGSVATWMIISVSCITYAYLVFSSSIAITQPHWQLVCAVVLACLGTGVYGSWVATFVVGPGTTIDVTTNEPISYSIAPASKPSPTAAGKEERSSVSRSRSTKSRKKDRANQTSVKPPAKSHVLDSSITSAFEETRVSSSSSAVAQHEKDDNIVDINGGCVPAVVLPNARRVNSKSSSDARDASLQPSTLAEDSDAHDERMCHVCRISKPEGAWHCRVCGVCALKRDHHCPWIGICVGRFNMVLYKMFLMFACFGSLIPMVIAFSSAYRITRGFENIVVVRDQVVQWYLMYATGQFASAEAAETWWAEIMSQCSIMLGGARLSDVLVLLLQSVLSSVVVFGVGFLIIIHILRIPLHRYIHRFVQYVQHSHEHED